MNNNNEELKALANIIKETIGKVTELDNILTEIKQETNKFDNVVRINGNNFTDYDKAIEYIKKIKSKEDDSEFDNDLTLFGIGHAILKWCQKNDKYYDEKLLRSALDKYLFVGTNYAKDVLRFYEKNLLLRQYRGRRYEGLVR